MGLMALTICCRTMFILSLRQVGLLDEVAAGEFGAAAGKHDLPGLQHIAVVGDFERTFGILLDQQDGEAALPEAEDQVEDLVATMDASDTGTTDEMSPDMSQTMKSLESFSSSVPSEIREDWKTIVATIKTYAEAIAGIDFNNLADPDTVAKLDKAGSAMDDAKFEKASENLDQWTQKNCPGFDF